MSETQPLLRNGGPNNPANNDNRDELISDEETGLIKEERRWKVAENVLLGCVSIVGIVLVLAVGMIYFRIAKDSDLNSTKRSVILMISDGFGPASETFARHYHSDVQGKGKYDDVLPLDKILVGTSRTRSSSSLITDSAAGATAFSCAMKTYNNAVGVDSRHRACGTVLESASRLGYTTGLVVTSRITHATPAAFSSHVIHRDSENDIALHQIGNLTSIGRTVDLMFGGGKCEFLPQMETGSCRMDNVDVFQLAKEKYGWSVVQDLDGAKNKPLPLMGLFAYDHMDFDIDRTNSQPSLAEMSKQALGILRDNIKGSDSGKGFFLMIEGSRIDMAAHNNDAATHVREILAYQEAIKVVMEYVDANPGTVLISVSDHETGGLTVGRQISKEYPTYEWHPENLEPVHHSTEYLTAQWLSHLRSHSTMDKETFLRKTIIKKGLGIEDITDDEVQELMEINTNPDNMAGIMEFMYGLGDLVSRRALVGFTTHAHTGIDVNLYAYQGERTMNGGCDNEHASRGIRKKDGDDRKNVDVVQRLFGSHENTDIGDYIIDYLGLDLGVVTKDLRKDPELINLPTYKIMEEGLVGPKRYGVHD